KACCQQGCEGWTLIVGGPTSKVALAVAKEDKGRLLPLRLIGWLHVEVIVDRHRGVRRVDHQLAKEHRIPGRLYDLNRSPTGPQDGGGCLCTPLDVFGVGRVHTDSRNFDEIVQQSLKFLAHRWDSLLQLSIQVCGHITSPSPLICARRVHAL